MRISVETLTKNIDSDSRQERRHRFEWGLIRGGAAHRFGRVVRGSSNQGQDHGARRSGECVRASGSIKGLAQSIANPAYRRLLTAEPALRRAVPALIIAFLLTIGVGAVVQVLDQHRQAIAEAAHDIDNVADFVSERFDRLASEERATPRGGTCSNARSRPVPRRSAAASCSATAKASSPPPPRPVADRLAAHRCARRDPAAYDPRRQRRRAGDHARRRQPRLCDGAHAGRHPCQVSVFQLRSEALAPWRSDTTLTVTLTATTASCC